jgi:zinc protease
MRTRAFVGLIIAFVLLGPAKAGHYVRSQAAQSPTDIPRLEFEKYTLPNGLEVILRQDRRLPVVAVNLWYHVGPANEEPGRTGFAHLFEHMMFQGSKHVPSDGHFQLLEAAGATGLNGTTDYDRTNYFETVPANQLALALWLESDRMGYLLEKVDQPALSNQQDVVRNERRQSVENQPYGLAEETLVQTLFPPGHPYYGNVIGSHEDIQAVRLDDVNRFFRQYYAPNNASLAVVGDIDVAETKKLVEKYFGTLRRGPAVPPIKADTPRITAERRRVVPSRVELPRVYMTWLTPRIFQAGDADAVIASDVLGGGRASRLYKKLVYDKQIAQNVVAFQESLTLGSMFRIQATARPGHTAEELERAIDEELAALRAAPPTAAEIERARNTIETGIIGGLERLGGFGGVADRLNMYNHYLGTPGFLEKDIQRYRSVTPASVHAFAREHLTTTARVVIHAVSGQPQPTAQTPTPSAPQAAAQSGEGGQSINADEPWRTEVPPPGPPRPLQVATPASAVLSNGLTLILSERRGLPIVSANLVLKTGSDANPADRPGLANFVAAMLDEGTATRSALQIADEVAQLGASLTTGSSTDATTISGRSLSKNVAATLNLLADITLHPSFPADEIERQRASRLAQLVQQRDSPAQVAGQVMAAALYGPRHPYGYTELGTEVSNKTMARDEMAAFWRQHFVPNNAALVVAGDMSMNELRALRWLARHDARASCDRRQAWHAADAAARRLDRRRAVLARLQGAAGDEQRAWGALLGPDQYEPARAARLQLRRLLAVPVPPQSGAVRGGGRHPDGCDRAGGHRDLQRDHRHDRQADERRRAAEGEGGARQFARRGVRDKRQHREQLLEHLHLRPRARLLHAARTGSARCDRRAGARGGPEVSRAGSARRDCGGRSEGDRARAAEAQSGRRRNPRRRGPSGQLITEHRGTEAPSANSDLPVPRWSVMFVLPIGVHLVPVGSSHPLMARPCQRRRATGSAPVASCAISPTASNCSQCSAIRPPSIR